MQAPETFQFVARPSLLPSCLTARLAGAPVDDTGGGGNGLLLLCHEHSSFCRLIGVLNDALFLSRQLRRQGCVKLGLFLLQLCRCTLVLVRTSGVTDVHPQEREG